MKDIAALSQVSDFPEEQLLVAVFPGVPTAAELFLLPHKNQSEGKKKSEEELEQVWETMIGFGLDHTLLKSSQIYCSIDKKTNGECSSSLNVEHHVVLCSTGIQRNCKRAEPKFGRVRAQAWCKGDCVQHTVNTG